MSAALRSSVSVPIAVTLLAGAAFSTAELSRSGGILGQRVLTTGAGDNGSGGTIRDLTAEIHIP